MKRFYTYILAVTALCSCTEHYLPEQIEIIELGASEKVLTCEEGQGDGSFEIYANCDWDYRQIDGQEWLSVDSVSPVEDGHNLYNLHFVYYANNGYPRSAKLVVFKENRYDTLQVRQNGIVRDSIAVKDFTGGLIPSEGGSYSVVVETAAPERCLKVSASDPDQFSELYYSGHRLFFTINPSVERDRKDYVLTVYMTDGWGETVAGSTTITQDARED